MKIYKAAIIGLGPSGLAVNKILYGDNYNEIIAFESEDINKRDNFFGFWLTDWMRPFENIIEKKPFYLCSIDINEYLSTEEVNRYLIYKNKEDENDILFYYGKVFLISDFTNINENLLCILSFIIFFHFFSLQDSIC